jgi:hypothetical protein
MSRVYIIRALRWLVGADQPADAKRGALLIALSMELAYQAGRRRRNREDAEWIGG